MDGSGLFRHGSRRRAEMSMESDQQGRKERILEDIPLTGAKDAPWFMIPPGHKGHHGVFVARRMVHTLERMYPGRSATLEDM